MDIQYSTTQKKRFVICADKYEHQYLCIFSTEQSIEAVWYMWHGQGERVGCLGYCFWDIGKERVEIPLFYIVFSVDKLII